MGTWAGWFEFPSTPASLPRNPSAPESQGAPLCCQQTKAGQISPDRRFILEPSVPRASRARGWSVGSSWTQGAPWEQGWAPSLSSQSELPVWAAEGTGGLRKGFGVAQSHGSSSSVSRELGQPGMGLGQLQGAQMGSPGRDFSSFCAEAALSWLCPCGQRLC